MLAHLPFDRRRLVDVDGRPKAVEQQFRARRAQEEQLSGSSHRHTIRKTLAGPPLLALRIAFYTRQAGGGGTVSPQQNATQYVQLDRSTRLLQKSALLAYRRADSGPGAVGDIGSRPTRSTRTAWSSTAPTGAHPTLRICSVQSGFWLTPVNCRRCVLVTKTGQRIRGHHAISEPLVELSQPCKRDKRRAQCKRQSAAAAGIARTRKTSTS